MASTPNMTPQGMKKWRQTQAYKQYRAYHDRQPWATEPVDKIWSRALQVIKNQSTPQQKQKVHAYIARHSQQEAGQRRFGKGRDKVSAHTASLRNWGYDPTGKYA